MNQDDLLVNDEEDPEEVKAKPKDNYEVKLVLSKKQLIGLGGLALIAILAALFINFNLWQKAYFWLNKASVKIMITDIDGVSVSEGTALIKGSKYNIEKTLQFADGEVLVTDLIKGDYAFTVNAGGYIEKSESVTLAKGENSKEIQLEKIPPAQATISGRIINYISGEVLSNTEVELNGEKANSGETGLFKFEKFDLGDYKMTIRRNGYLVYDKEIKIDEVEEQAGDIALVPEGKVVFVSNRDRAKKGIYTANYDGSDQKELIARVGDFEDFRPVVSSDNKKVAFLSNRDGAREKGILINRLYVINIDGTGLKKISDNKAEYDYSWIKNSGKLLWKSYQDSGTKAYVYNLASGVNLEIGAEGSFVNFTVIDDTENQIAYSTRSADYKFSLYYADLGTLNPVTVYEGFQSVYVPKFSNGKLIYSMYDSASSSTKYYSYDITAGASTEITYDNQQGDTYVNSNSGAYRATISSRDGKSNVYLVDKNDNEVKITSIDTALSPVSWSLNDKYLIFNSHKSGESALYIVSAAGGEAKKVVDIAYEGYGY